MQRVYKIFLSCEGDLIINNKPIEESINNYMRVPMGDVRPKIVCINPVDVHTAKQNMDLLIKKQDLKKFKDNCVYVIDTHRELDKTAYWQLGYAMGGGMSVIGYFDVERDKNISDAVDKLTVKYHSANIERFFTLISDQIADTMGVSFSKWNKVGNVVKKETGGA